MSSASLFTGTPVCRGCGENTSRAITNPPSKPEYEIGNTGRPYYKCEIKGCENKFYCFDDYRGILDDNPLCHCGRPSRRRISGKAPYDSSFLQVQCATAACDYSERELDRDGGRKTVPRTEILEWIRLSIL